MGIAGIPIAMIMLQPDLGTVLVYGAILAIELLWAKHLASRFAASGGVVLQTERIPAPVVNAALAEAEVE